MKIKTRIQVSIILCIVLTVTVGLFVFMAIQKMNNVSQEARIAAVIVKDMAELNIATHEYLLHPGERPLVQWKSKYSSLTNRLTKDENKFNNPDEKIGLNKIHQNLVRLGTVFSNLTIGLGKEQGLDRQKDPISSELQNRLIGELLINSQATVSPVFHLQKAIQDEVEATQKRSAFFIFIFLVVFIFLIVGILFWTNMSIARPIIMLEEGIQIIGSGNLSHKVGTDAKDEIGALSRSFDKMTKDLNKTTTSIDELRKEMYERERAEEYLRSERNKFIGVINAIGEGLYIVNQNFTIEYQNEVLSKNFGNTKGKKCFNSIFQSNKPCDFCTMHEVIKSGKTQSFETPLADGRTYNIVFSPFMDVDGNVKAIVLMQDITEKKTLQAETMRVGHLSSLGELAAGVAHEINNPITGIISFAEILKDQCNEQGEDDEIPASIIEEGVRVAAIVKNLLSFARDRKEEYSPVHIRDILANTLGLAERQIHKDGIKFSMDVPVDLPKIKARSQEIQQVFLNIISNARYALNRRYSGFNNEKLFEIKCETTKIEGKKHIRTTFFDTGTGIPENILDKISNPFFTTKPKGEGTGLGLSISHGIIENHGGKLRSESVEGEFTKVMIDLPVDNGREL